MEWIETTARTLAEAKEEALDHLGVAEEDAEFEVVAEPRSGFLGVGRSDARVRARVKPKRPRPKDGRRPRRRRQETPSMKTATAARGVAAGVDEVVEPRLKKGRRDGDVGHNGEGSPDQGKQGKLDRKETAGKRMKATRPGQGGPAQEARPELGRRRAKAADMGRVEEGKQMDSMDLSEQGELARQFLVGVLERFALDGEVTVAEVDDETVELSVSGGGLGLLIGPKGATVTALQDLVRTVVQRHSGGRSARLLVDVAGYRARRKAALERYVRRVGEDVKTSGVAEVLESMSPADRKVVHDTINEMPGVSTRSEGDEPRRWVVVLPADG